MRIRKTFTWALVAALFACNNEQEENLQGGSGGESAEVAYVSFSIYRNTGFRSSEGGGDAAESALKSLYLLTFDANGTITQVPGTTMYYAETLTASLQPPAIKVSGKSEKLLVIANPGPALKNVMDNQLNSTTTFESFNQSISTIKISDLIDNAANTKGYAMISSGNDALPATDITDPRVDVTAHLEKVSAHGGNEANAIAAAEGNRVLIKIERLASKVEFSVKSSLTVKPNNSTFALVSWNLDGLNSTYFPFAHKKILRNNHTGIDYASSFYTTDPNFTGMPVGQGIYHTTVNSNFEPVFPDEGYQNWLAGGGKTYCVENTMAAAEQKFGNATRVVIKGTYYYDQTVTGDWFNFAGINYPSLQDLKDAYNAAPAVSNLRAACDKMYQKISDYYTAVLQTPLPATGFLTLDEAELAAVQNGGQVIKDGLNSVIRWYQNGLCYYYYQIRHNQEATGEMAFSKYGVVRNHTYQLELATVNGAGTPWYPDINEPGPGDPDPTDPIDKEAAYLGVEIKVMPWLIWAYDIDV